MRLRKPVLITIFMTAIALAAVHLLFTPHLSHAQDDNDTATITLDRDTQLIASTTALQTQLAVLQHRYPYHTTSTVEAAFLRTVNAVATRRHIVLITATWQRTVTLAPAGFRALPVALDLQGRWANLIWALADLNATPVVLVYALPNLTDSNNILDLKLTGTLLLPDDRPMQSHPTTSATP